MNYRIQIAKAKGAIRGLTFRVKNDKEFQELPFDMRRQIKGEISKVHRSLISLEDRIAEIEQFELTFKRG